MSTVSPVARLVADWLDKGIERGQVVRDLAAYLIDNRQAGQLDRIMHQVETIRAQRGLLEADVTSAFPLTEDLKREVLQILQKRFPNKRILLREKVDAQLLGGVQLRAGGEELDASIRQKLQQLKGAVS